MRRIVLSMLILVLMSGTMVAQERVVTFGVQIKPIIPSSIFRTATTDLNFNDVDYRIRQRVGFSGGMVIRKGLTKILSLETGLNFVTRNYQAAIFDNITEEDKQTDFSLVTYELPVLGLVYIRLSKKVYMNAAFGASLNLYPSDLASGTPLDFQQVSIRRSWILPALVANVGWEYRTEKSGYFYIGGSFNRFFSESYDSVITHFRMDPNNQNVSREEAVLGLSGNYLTIDFRYFFHEDPEKKKAKKKKKKKYDNPNDWRNR